MIELSLLHGRIRSSIALLVIGFSGWTAGGRAEEAITPMPEEIFPQLKGIMQAALQQSPQMIHKNIELATGEANRMAAAAQRLPQIGSGVSYNVSEASVSSNTNVSSRSSGVFYSMSASQVLYRWGTVQAQVDSASIQLNIARRNYAEAYRLLAVSIRTQYLGLVAKKVAWRNAVAARVRLAAIVTLQEENLKYGRIAAGELITPQLDYEDAALRADRAAGDFAQGKSQPDVGRGKQDRAVVEAMHAHLQRLVPTLDLIQACYHGGDAHGQPCDCRKPKPGMLTAAAAQLGLDLARSWMVGDRWGDIDAGHAAGCRTVFIDHGYTERAPARPPHFTTGSFPEAVGIILAES